MPADATQDLSDRVRDAQARGTPLCIRAGGTKDFYGEAPAGGRLDPRGHAGIVAYDPSELVVTARCGTPLAELEAELAGAGQMLAFEPPHFGPAATVGGCIAAGLSGPRRASAGAARDFVVGARLLDGRGQVLRFGGTVMKNVAGFDVARALAGSLGTLGVLLEVSLKVLPRPAAQATLEFALDEAEALRQVNRWAGQPLPVTASAWADGRLRLRLEGSERAIEGALAELAEGAAVEPTLAGAYWHGLREQLDPFFAGDEPLWRLGLPSAAPALGLPGAQLIEWGGAQRWLRSSLDATAIRRRAAELGGHATWFRRPAGAAGVFTPLASPLLAIHQRLKAQFDPAGVFNRGRMYAGF